MYTVCLTIVCPPPPHPPALIYSGHKRYIVLTEGAAAKM